MRDVLRGPEASYQSDQGGNGQDESLDKPTPSTDEQDKEQGNVNGIERKLFHERSWRLVAR